jgi:hypothetical protein
MELEHKDVTEAIISAAFEVYKSDRPCFIRGAALAA